MREKTIVIKTIGYSLAALYGVILLFFLWAVYMQKYDEYVIFYCLLFAVLFISAIAVARLREWGRKLLIALNVLTLVCLAIRYVPKIGIVPTGFIFMNIIVFLYFTQNEIRNHFFVKSFDKWISVLVIDDDEALIKTIRPLLISNGYSVLTADSGENGLIIAESQQPDIILLDVILPGIKGREVCKRLKSNDKTKDIPVVFVTAKDSEDDIKAEKEVGAAAHLTKPINKKMLMETLKNVLKKPVF